MNWPPAWDRSAWDLFLTVSGFALSVYAVFRTRRVVREVRRRLADSRLGGMLAELEMAGAAFAGIRSEGAFENACAQWRRASSDARALLNVPSDAHRLSLHKQLVVVAGMIRDSSAEIEKGQSVANATIRLRQSVFDAADEARGLRTKLEMR